MLLVLKLYIEVRINSVAILQVQEVENNLDVPTDADEEPRDVNYLFPFSLCCWLIHFSFTIFILKIRFLEDLKQIILA